MGRVCSCGRDIDRIGEIQCYECWKVTQDTLQQEAWVFRDNPNMTLYDFEKRFIAPRMMEKNMQKRWLTGTDWGFEPSRGVAVNMAVTPTGRIFNLDRIEVQNIPMPEDVAERLGQEMMKQMQREIAAALAVPPALLGETGVNERTDEVRLQEFEELLVKSETLLNHFS